MNKQMIAYAPHIEIKRSASGWNDYHVIDQAAKRKIGHITTLKGFIHYEGVSGTAHAGIKAVIRPNGPDFEETMAEAFKNGIHNGRDDRR